MGGRRGVVALWVMLGFVLLLGIIILTVLIRSKQVEVQEPALDESTLSENPELHAQRELVNERIIQCIEEKIALLIEEFEAGDYEEEVRSLDDVELLLEEEISAEIPDCYFRFNTGGETIIPDALPSVDLQIGEEEIIPFIDYPAIGNHDGARYDLGSPTIRYESGFGWRTQNLLEALDLLEAAITGNADEENPFIEEGALNLYGLGDNYLYPDVLVNPDGSCEIIISDYGPYHDGTGEPVSSPVRTIEQCNLDPGQGPMEQEVLPAQEITCTANPCYLDPDTSQLSTAATIMTPDITVQRSLFNASQWVIKTDGLEPGDYYAFILDPRGNEPDRVIPLTITIP